VFDIGFSEIVVCAVVGLVVIGPERLPETVRTVSLWVGRIKRNLRSAREDIERHVGMEEVHRQLHTEEMMRTLDQLNAEIDSALHYDRKQTLVLENNEVRTDSPIIEDLNMEDVVGHDDDLIQKNVKQPVIS
jgi:Tat protein translocase TatB subunit